MMSNYLLDLLSVAEDQEQTDALEWAIYNNWVVLTYDKAKDQAMLLSELPRILERWRRICIQHEMEQAALFAA